MIVKKRDSARSRVDPHLNGLGPEASSGPTSNGEANGGANGEADGGVPVYKPYVDPVKKSDAFAKLTQLMEVRCASLSHKCNGGSQLRSRPRFPPSPCSAA